jgi:hypothetical protein
MAPVQGTTTSRPALTEGAPTLLPVRDVLTRVAVSVGVAVIAPAALLWAGVLVFNVAAAVSIALAWMVGAMSWRWATRRPVSGVLLLSVGVLTVKTTFTLATGNTFVYFAQPVLADITIATVFLGSLWSATPVIARLAPEFFPMDPTVAARPEVRAHFRRLTLMWGLVIVLKATITWWLLESLSTVDFVLIKGGAIITLTLTAAVVTVVWSVLVGRREGLLLKV